jgi:arylsulfatase
MWDNRLPMGELTRRQLFRTAAAVPLAGQAAAAPRPNVLLIMADQLRADALGAWGNSVIRTPHLDALARTGARFTNHWTQHPVCMPSRASIFTGRYPSAHRVRSNGVPLAPTEVTLAQLFAGAGYRTGGAGKFHFIPHLHGQLPTMETHPGPFYGFTEFHMGEDGRRGEQAVWISRNYPQYAGKPDNQIPLKLHNSTWSADHTIRFIRESVAGHQPFFAFCSFVDPHHPYNPPSPYREMYRETDMPAPWRKDGEHDDKPPFYAGLLKEQRKITDRLRYFRTQYFGEITLIDDSIGRILQSLEETGQRAGTIIVFCSDHGDSLGDHDIWYKGPYHYRPVACTPLIINWPGRVREGKVVDGLVQTIDIFPTLTELAGIANPPGVQGRSQAAVLTTAAGETGYTSALIEFADSGAAVEGVPNHLESGDLYTLVTPEWRMSYYPARPWGELYNLREDPHEFANLYHSPSTADVRRKLKDELLDRIAAAHDPLPVRQDLY